MLSELEDEKRKHAQDTAQGDDVTYMLEKDRQRLKQEVGLTPLVPWWTKSISYHKTISYRDSCIAIGIVS